MGWRYWQNSFCFVQLKRTDNRTKTHTAVLHMTCALHEAITAMLIFKLQTGKHAKLQPKISWFGFFSARWCLLWSKIKIMGHVSWIHGTTIECEGLICGAQTEENFHDCACVCCRVQILCGIHGFVSAAVGCGIQGFTDFVTEDLKKWLCHLSMTPKHPGKYK